MLSVAAALLLASCGGGREPVKTRLAPLPQVSGTLNVGGLTAPVAVIRDRWGIPHIKASNQDDLFFAQGFVQAQDRLFQMDLWRRSVQGRLSAVLGPNFVERDAMTRRIQFRGDVEADWASYGADVKAIAAQFVRGINAWIRLAHDPFPEEFVLAGWAPELWRPEDLLNRTDAFVASADAQDEIVRARLVAAVGASRAGALLGRTLVPAPDVELDAILPIVGDIVRRAGAPPFFLGLAAPLSAAGIGSNAWAIAQTDAGTPLLAGDPHRPLDGPSPRYLVHLQAPGWNVIGATAPWLPGVAIGHNERVSWSMTASRADVQDVYVERLNPDNPRQVLRSGRWIDVVVEKDSIAVKGRKEPFEYERLSTARGVIIALDRQLNLAYGVRWSGAEPGTAAELGALALDRARSAAEFREALARWRMPAAEFVYADVEGRIGRQLAALVPRRPGWQGLLPVPGHQGEYEWAGWQAPDRAPSRIEPQAATVASANSRARLNRIIEGLKHPSTHRVDGFRKLQHDTLSWNAGQLVPLLAALRAERPAAEDARSRLLGWDRRVASGSAEASIYVRWEEALLKLLVARRVPPHLADEFAARAGELLVPALVSPSRTWFDGDVRSQRDALLLAALDNVVETVEGGGKTPGMSVIFAHPLAVTDPARRRFNVGPFDVGGYRDTILSMAPAGAGRVAGPSFRAILDPGDWDRSVAVNAPGQSGSPASPHFSDLAALWASGDYFPLSFSDAAVAANAQTTLMLVPK
jgi:penicillin amidase